MDRYGKRTPALTNNRPKQGATAPPQSLPMECLRICVGTLRKIAKPVCHGFRPIARAKPAEQCRKVKLHRPLAKRQFSRDCLVGTTLPEQPQDFALPGRDGFRC